jgi:hypothetical protein
MVEKPGLRAASGGMTAALAWFDGDLFDGDLFDSALFDNDLLESGIRQGFDR